MTLRGALPGRKPGTRVRSATWRYAVAKCRSTSAGGTSISRTTRDPLSGRVDTVTKAAPGGVTVALTDVAWWARRDSNSHVLRHRLLRPTRLPFRHSPAAQ